jgi:hypothetical protein
LYSRDPDKWTKLQAATIASLRYLQALLKEVQAAPVAR